MVSIIKKLFDLNDEYEITPIEEHEGGRNWVFACKYMNQPKYVIRVSSIGDRKEKEYWAEVSRRLNELYMNLARTDLCHSSSSIKTIR